MIHLNKQASRTQAGLGSHFPLSQLRIMQLQKLNAGHYNSIDRLSCSYSRLENSSLDQLPVENRVMADSVFSNLTSPEIVVPLCTFLAYLSTQAGVTTGDSTIEDLAFKPITGDLSSIHELGVRLESMLNVSHRIQRYLGSNPHGEEVVKFNLMVSYTMLYLTLEYGIVPAMVAEDHNIRPQELHRKKLPLLCEMLSKLNGAPVKIVSLKEKIRYGKVLWEMINTAGVIILPALAVTGPGISVLAHKFGLNSNQIPLLGARLAASNLWMTLCQALSPITVELIFTYSTQTYTCDALLHRVIQEPLPSCILQGIYEKYLELEHKGDLLTKVRINRVGSSLSHRMASKVLVQFGLPMAIFPPDKYSNPASHQVKLAQWLLLEDENRELHLPVDSMANNPRPRQVSLGVFSSFLEPSRVDDRAVGFLSGLWNQRAMPGWGILSPHEASKVLDGSLGSDLQAAITLALGGRRFTLQYHNVIMPIITPQMVLPLLVSLTDKTATLYYLGGGDAGLEASTKLIKVSQYQLYV